MSGLRKNLSQSQLPAADQPEKGHIIHIQTSPHKMAGASVPRPETPDHPSRGVRNQHLHLAEPKSPSQNEMDIDDLDLYDDARPRSWWWGVRYRFREPLAEFFGTFIVIIFGNGSVAQVVLSQGNAGTYQSISWGWG